MFMAHIHNDGFNFYLIGTTWTCDISRGFKYETKEDAQKALNNAKKFMAPALRKFARIIEMV